MDRQLLEHEFSRYKIALGFVEQYRKFNNSVLEINFIKKAQSDSEDTKVLEGLTKAFGGLLEKPMESASNWVTERFMSPNERFFRASVRAVKLVQEELGLEINQISPNLVQPIMEGIAYGYNDESIQSKWQKLLEACMAGKDVRAKYTSIIQKLDPPDAKILDLIYRENKIHINELYAVIQGREAEIELSLSKLAELRLCFVGSNTSHQKKIGEAIDTLTLFGQQGYGKNTQIITNEKRNNNPAVVNIQFSPLGVAFMSCVTQELKPNSPSDTSSQTSAN